ncbi:MAG: YjcG family protein [Anoxybacillus ayderensis]|nr:YjcG family protein [Anoxybacillus ayderensis]
MKYGIALFPSKQIQDFANSYRKRYDSHYALIPPHITLKNVFEADDIQAQTIIKTLRQIAAETDVIPLKITKFSSFYPVNNVIYLKVEKTEPLAQLHEKLHRPPFVEQTDYAFVPHITIARDLSNDEYSDVFGRFNMQSVYFEEQVDRFHLLYQLENGSWSAYETFHLGKE